MLKKTLDIAASLLIIIILSPAFIVISILVYLNLGLPIFFIQKRPGKNEKIFNMYKFRTMTNNKTPSGQLLSDEHRLTWLGKFLRKSSLGELILTGALRRF
jgi:undecaprenyl phosphate N,N'-diacetylbacillosamine 1-phosphate transferase